MKFNMKLVMVFSIGLAFILVYLMIFPLLRQQYLTNCHLTGWKVPMGCESHQTNWQFYLGMALGILAVWVSPLVIGFGSLYQIYKNKKQNTIYGFLPVLMLISFVIMSFALTSIINIYPNDPYRNDFPAGVTVVSIFTALSVILISVWPRKNKSAEVNNLK